MGGAVYVLVLCVSVWVGVSKSAWVVAAGGGRGWLPVGPASQSN